MTRRAESTSSQLLTSAARLRARLLKSLPRSAETDWMRRQPVVVTSLTAAVSVAATLVITLTPSIHLAYRSPSLHIVIETAGTLVAVVAAVLTFGRFRQSGYAGDLLLFSGLFLLGATNLIFSVVPSVLGTSSAAVSVWAPVTTRLAGATFIALAAFASNERVWDRRRAPWIMAAACVGLFAAVGLGAGLLGEQLPIPIDQGISPEASSDPMLVGHPALLLAQALGALLYGAAAVGFTRGAAAGRGGMFAWLGAATACAAFAAVNYLLFPSIYGNWVYTGDGFRLAFYVLLLLGEIHEIRKYWRAEAVAAALEERRRLARELHDGLAQELAFIVREASGKLPRAQLASAAERALAESRRAIAALSTSPDGPLAAALREAGEDVAGRTGGTVVYEIPRQIEVCPSLRENLIRIMREGILNAIRHGHAEHVRVRLVQDEVLQLLIEDDGTGFDLGAVRDGGYGLRSMRERAEAAGGSFSVRSVIGTGTTVEVVLP